jgi:hypothetical protein
MIDAAARDAARVNLEIRQILKNESSAAGGRRASTTEGPTAED